MTKNRINSAIDAVKGAAFDLADSSVVGSVTDAVKRHPKTAIAVGVGATAAAAMATVAFSKQAPKPANSKAASKKAISGNAGSS
jgi:hypothetical protein